MAIPVVVEPVVVRHNLAIVPVAITHVKFAIRVAEMCEAPSMSLPAKEYHYPIHRLYRISHDNAIALHTKYLHFLKCLHKPSV
jgi:hypothetical protein